MLAKTTLIPMRMRQLLILGALIAGLRDARGADPEWLGAPKNPFDALGRRLFLREWTADDPRGRGGDGLGPVFNERSCVACHGLGGPGGGGSLGKNVELLTVINSSIKKKSKPDRTLLGAIHPALLETGGIVLHRFGLSPKYADWRANTRALDDKKFPWSMKVQELTKEGFRVVFSRRNAPALFGSGRIDSISEDAILAEENRQNALAWYADSATNLRGRVSRLKDGRIGRFGWKGQVADLNEFVRTACANEMGLEVPGHHQVADPLGYGDRDIPRLDMSDDDCRALVSYVRYLPAPVERSAEFTEAGRIVFDRIGCAECHRPRLGNVEGIYSDLLLHDMGQGLSDDGQYYGSDDGISPGTPKSQEWKTPPLWGLAASGPFLHDGRAKTITAAIKAHGGQGQVAVKAFNSLSQPQMSQIMSFLHSLQGPPASQLGPGHLTRREQLAESAEAVGAGQRNGSE